MVTATAHNIKELLDGKEPTHEPTWNVFCLADLGNKGIAFLAKPQNPPRNLNWSSGGRWVHYAKIAFDALQGARAQTRNSGDRKPKY